MVWPPWKKKRRERQQMLLLLLNISSIWHSCHPSIFIPSFDINDRWLDCGFVVYRTGLTVERFLFSSVLCPCRWEESARLEDRCWMFALQQNIFHGLQFCVTVDVEKPHFCQWKPQPERDRNHLLTHKSWVALHLLWSVWILDVEDILLYTFILFTYSILSYLLIYYTSFIKMYDFIRFERVRSFRIQSEPRPEIRGLKLTRTLVLFLFHGPPQRKKRKATVALWIFVAEYQ